MKVLVLSCSTGEGHNSAAKAICEALTAIGAEYEFKDPVSFRGEKTPKKIASMYNNLIKKAPAAFGMVYKIGDAYDRSLLPSPVYAWNASYADKLADYIKNQGFDAVITTHLYGMLALTAAKKNGDIYVPIFGVGTDYTMIPFTRNAVMDEFFVPHKDLLGFYTEKGVKENTLNPTGIPVSPKVSAAPEKRVAREILGLPQDKKIVLLMSGGVGCESVKPLLKKLHKNGDDGALWVVLVGNNQKLKQTIEKSVSHDKVLPVGFTDKVALYLRASDVVISKAGGLSSTEVAVSRVPLVHFKPIPGCETCNAEFFAAKGMSVLAKNGKEAIALAEELLTNEEKRNAMIAAQQREINPHAAEDIVRSMQRWISNK